MTHLTEAALLNAIALLTDDAKRRMTIKPKQLFIPGPTRAMLAEQGYDTQEKVLNLVNGLLMVTEDRIDEIK